VANTAIQTDASAALEAHKHTAKRKGYAKALDQTLNTKIRTGLEAEGLSDFQELDPLSLDK